jgi:N-glycosylase/DNA lyase
MKTKELRAEYEKYKKEIKERLEEFSNLPESEYIYELFFCLLTPQSKAEKCWQAVEEIKKCEIEKNKIESCLKTKTRFYRNKTRYLIEASKSWDEIKRIIDSNKKPREMRELLVKEIKGLGMKEASHFLRNINKSRNQLAILDRHILEQLIKLGIITQPPQLNKKNYLLIEKKMKKFSEQIGIPLDELDLLFWKIESGRIFK